MFRTLGQVDWDDIEVGEVFAYNGCWQIHCKINNTESMLLATDDHEGSWDTGFIDGYWGVPRVDANTYRLPKSVQRQYYEPEG